MPLTVTDDEPTAADPPAQGAHMLEITGYGSLHGRVVESAAFHVGGYEWAISFNPGGGGAAASAYVSASLALLTRRARVRASFNLGLVRRGTGRPAFQPEDTTAVFDTTGRCRCAVTTPACRHDRTASAGAAASHGAPRLVRRCEVAAAYLRDDDAVTVACAVTVVSGGAVLLRSSPAAAPEVIRVPEPDLAAHVGGLLASREGADVTFDVDGEAFAAHRIILATRSPVFEAELYGPATETTTTTTTTTDAHPVITVRDMRPAIFRALLHFVYTDSLPGMSHLGVDEMRELVQGLLVAADRYAMDRLKVVCEHVLARALHVETAATTLVLADRHRCDRLKRACIHFMASSDMGDDVARSVGEDKVIVLEKCSVPQFY